MIRQPYSVSPVQCEDHYHILAAIAPKSCLRGAIGSRKVKKVSFQQGTRYIVAKDVYYGYDHWTDGVSDVRDYPKPANFPDSEESRLAAVRARIIADELREEILADSKSSTSLAAQGLGAKDRSRSR